MAATLKDTTLRGRTVIVGDLTVPNASVPASAIPDGADIQTTKTVHRHALNYFQAGGSAIATATVPIHIARGTTGTLLALEAAILTAAAGNATVTIDLQKSTGAGAFATVLDSVITVDNATVVRTAEAATLDTTSFTDGDIYQLVITATVGTGTLPQGLIVTTTIDETPA